MFNNKKIQLSRWKSPFFMHFQYNHFSVAFVCLCFTRIVIFSVVDSYKVRILIKLIKSTSLELTKID
ncbi:hypothetical protein ERO13_A12G055750v2 [Gossypium hirsutum]|uniref:Uncharacterized protein n=1 Tax=Gossypium mustelinum TaxID=34275 RepID=A0A5D2WQD3_GOSMU|nr:hypothetical protein ERO13_A12G055750v2 [Gossypium hirsutum]TYJ03904.1 hypothetical protein E1A91_A12G059100v1 [Gossypium mustelinum]